MAKRRVLLCAAVLASMALPASDGLAHGVIQGSAPAEGDTRKNPPRHIRITFTEAPTEDSQIDVMDGCDRNVVDEQFVDGRTKHVFLKRNAQPGGWNVTYRIISAEDGHPTRGGYDFRVRGKADCGGKQKQPQTEGPGDEETQAAPGTDPTGAEGEEEDGFPLMPVALGAGGLVLVAALVRVFAMKDDGS